MDKKENKDIKVIARNKKAYHDYEVIQTMETGVDLVGTEVKSIRAGMINLVDSYAHCESGQIFLYHMHIGPYERGNQFNHDPYRKRRLLMHKQEIVRLCGEVDRKRLSLVPLQLYFKKQWVKVEIGLCRGRKQYDKREKIATAESKRNLSRMVKASFHH